MPTVERTNEFAVRLDHGFAELKLPSKLSEKDIKKIGLILEVCAVDIGDGDGEQAADHDDCND